MACSPAQQIRQFFTDRIVAEFEVERVAAVFVVVLDGAFPFEAEMFVEGDGFAIRGTGVTGDAAVVFGDAGDKSLAEAVPAVLIVDGQKEDVSVAAHGGEADQAVAGAIDVEVDPRAAIGVTEEAASLSENAVLLPDPLFQFPGGIDVIVVPTVDDQRFDVDAHYHT